ncbi:hypothetical protein EAG18_03945 [Pseudoalteromonas sp. J010]|uniref:hypothetical protein n=1 Tax=Pseudoalteromonas sp. J010 TaxID=998465 RepID=UPI000F64E08D|nr:hypothetical protein [Pseudoalteromonas sp. J010]RRS10091.1 hypothetical protein EAG18_03945 [Pseudoalteromonas sp. J010]
MRKAYVYLGLFICTLFAIDAVNRLQIQVDASSKPFRLDNTQQIYLPKLAEQSKTDIEQTLETWVVKKAEQPDAQNNGMSLDEQAKQTGELTSVFARDKELRLKAVVQSSGSTYALIDMTSVKTGANELKRLDHGEVIEDFILTIKSNTKVELNKGEQHITLIMYQSTNQ